MKTTHSSTLATEVPVYAELQREIHNALRAQHPEWVQPNGDSPICDAYESRFAEVLQFERTHARYACQAYRGKKHSLSQASFRDSSFFSKRKEAMNKIIEPSTPRMIGSPRGLEPGRTAKLITQWQSGPQTLVGYEQRKLRPVSARLHLDAK
jgi:hypothetical protein